MQQMLVLDPVLALGVILLQELVPVLGPLLHQVPYHLLGGGFLLVVALGAAVSDGVRDHRLQLLALWCAPPQVQQTLQVVIQEPGVLEHLVDVHVVVLVGERTRALSDD